MNCLDSLLLAIAAFLLEPQSGLNREDDTERKMARYSAMKSAYECVLRERKEGGPYIDTSIICEAYLDSTVAPPQWRNIKCDTIIKLQKRDNGMTGVDEWRTKGWEKLEEK